MCVGILMVVLCFSRIQICLEERRKEISQNFCDRDQERKQSGRRFLKEVLRKQQMQSVWMSSNLEIEEDYDTIKEYIDREDQKRLSGIDRVFRKRRTDSLLSAVRKEENPADLGESGRNRRKNDPCLLLMCRIWQNVWQKNPSEASGRKSRWYI